MKLVKILCGVVALAVIGGFAYVAMTDVTVPAREISTTIPNERFFDAQ
ncbi:MAG: hypothetical protein H6867_09940 [Rhodospirillales bacterium]|nr:hypothetical protein [Rhodospirillales bacterium]MCB9995896.1 hypothetical protein [Rhodospirillales bacterium]